MASKKTFEIAFKIGAQVASSFGTGFKNANKALNDLNNNTTKLKKNMDGLQSLAKKGLAIGGVGLAGAGFAAKAAMDAETAMAEFKKVLNGTEAEGRKFQKEFMDIAAQTGKSFADVVQMAAAAAQSGIAKSEISRFTKDSIAMGVAFDMTAEEAGQSMAEMRVQFKLTQDGVVQLGDKINYLGNTTPNASKKITEVVQRVGSLAKLANLTSDDVAALGASVVGMEPEVVATGLKNVIFALSAGSSATKSQRAAYAELGLTAEQVNKSMQKDAQKTTLTILKAIRKLPKEQQASMLTNLFGKEGVGVTSQLVDNLSDVEKNLAAISSANQKAWKGSMYNEYLERSKTTEMAIARAKAALMNIAITIGNQLLPYIKEAADFVSRIANGFQDWAQKNPQLVATISKVAITIAAIVAGLSALSIGFIAIVGPITMASRMIFGVVGGFMRLFTVARYLLTVMPFVMEIFKWLGGGLVMKAISLLRMIGTAFLWLGRIFLMNPIGLVITAIIAAIYLLWTNWDTVSKYMGQAWDWIKQKGNELLTWFQSLPTKFFEFGRNLFQGFINGISSMYGAVVEKAKSIASAVTNTVKDAFGINSPSKVFAEFGMWNMQGLANGMSDNAPVAANASQSAVTSVMPSGNSITSNRSSSSYSISVTVNGGGDNVAQQAQTGVMDAVKQIEKAKQREARLSYA